MAGIPTSEPPRPSGEPPRNGAAGRSLAARVGLGFVQALATLAVLLYFLFDDLVLVWLRLPFAYFGRLRLFVRLALWMRRRTPYQALLLFAVPFIVLEPFKLGGLVLVGTGHLVSGTAMLTTSHLLSLLIVERIFHVTEHQLLAIAWFAWVYGVVMQVKDWAFARLKASAVWRVGVTIAERARLAFRPGVRLCGRVARSLAVGWRRLFARLRAARN